VNTAIQEDANASFDIPIKRGHNEYFKYMYDLLKKKRGAAHIKIFGGGRSDLPSEELQPTGTHLCMNDDEVVLWDYKE
jgi:methylmalonyl-CoA mutase